MTENKQSEDISSEWDSNWRIKSWKGLYKNALSVISSNKKYLERLCSKAQNESWELRHKNNLLQKEILELKAEIERLKGD